MFPLKVTKRRQIWTHPWWSNRVPNALDLPQLIPRFVYILQCIKPLNKIAKLRNSHGNLRFKFELVWWYTGLTIYEKPRSRIGYPPCTKIILIHFRLVQSREGNPAFKPPKINIAVWSAIKCRKKKGFRPSFFKSYIPFLGFARCGIIWGTQGDWPSCNTKYFIIWSNISVKL